jgi:hypothetical protein
MGRIMCLQSHSHPFVKMRSTIIYSQLVKQPLSKKILGCKLEPPIIECVPVTKHYSIFYSFLNLFRTSLFVITNLKIGNLFQKVTQLINLIANHFFSLGTLDPFQSNNQTLLHKMLRSKRNYGCGDTYSLPFSKPKSHCHHLI